MKNIKIKEGLPKFIDVEKINKFFENKYLSQELKWIPYVGSNYSKNNDRVLIVGKSYYDWGSEDSKKQLNDFFFNSEAIIWNGLGVDRWKGTPIENFKKAKFYRSLERIFYNTTKIYSEDFQAGRELKGVSFTNPFS